MIYYRGYTIKKVYPMNWGWFWFHPDTYDGESKDAGNGTVENCKEAIDEYLDQVEADKEARAIDDAYEKHIQQELNENE